MRARRLTVVSIVAWGVIALASSAEYYAYTQRTPNPIGFVRAIASQAPSWAVWSLATQPIIALSRRFPIAWPLHLRALAVHTAVWLVTAAAFIVMYNATRRLVLQPDSTAPYVLQLWQSFVGWSPFLLTAYGSIVGAGHAVAYAEQVRREQAEKAALATQLVEAQLGALRMQLQPHFLFNTLNSVAMLIRSAEHARAVEMIALLGDVLRSLLRSSSDLESTLADELELLRRYLEIEQVRFGDRLRVEWRVEDQAMLGLVPPLILQPVVENALRHGLWPLPDGGELVIAARRTAGDLELEVIDQGVGLAPGFTIDGSRGVGLGNVRARLDRMYGGAAALDVATGDARGVRVRLRLPFHVVPRFDGKGARRG